MDLPVLSWMERYKRMYNAYDSALKTVFHRELKERGMDAALDLLIQVHTGISSTLGRKLSEKLRLPPDVRGGLMLMWAYSVEVWGFGMTGTCEVNMESERRGFFTNKVCHYWETWLRESRALRCDRNCIHEYGFLVRSLNPDFRLSMPKSFPNGDDCCQFVLESE
jgi:hypothetical protein